jgi:hypothetical protein
LPWLPLLVIIPVISQMKPLLFASALLFAPVCAADPPAAQTQPPVAGNTYQQFIEKMGATENLTDCVSKMDGLIDDVEHIAATQNTPHGLETDTKLGLHLAFCIISNKQVVIYYLIISRNGEELGFADAAKLAAFFGDRAGLPHPVAITEGEKPVFYAQWLIKRSDWDAMHKMMVKVRAENRSEKDPRKAFVTAIIREINSRQGVPPAVP